jgi:hypothetical protein
VEERKRLTFELVSPAAMLEGCTLIRHWMRPLQDVLDAGFLYTELTESRAFLVHILVGKQVVGMMVYQFGTFEGEAALTVKALGGAFPRGWHVDFTDFVNSLASGFNVSVVEFCTKHKWKHLVANAGYREIGTLYRR